MKKMKDVELKAKKKLDGKKLELEEEQAKKIHRPPDAEIPPQPKPKPEKQ